MQIETRNRTMTQTMLKTQTQRQTILRATAAAVALAASLLTTGCGGAFTAATIAPVTTAGVPLGGRVYGGQQPVQGAALQLYQANLTGYGKPSFALLNTAVLTDANGAFNITGDYTCSAPTAPVYLVATGGNSGSGVNPSLALMAALGPCGNLTPTTSIQMNELTSVASIYALSPFMSSINQLSTSATNVTGLSNAFSTVNKLTTIASGSIPGTLPAGTTAPIAELNTLADIMAACINSAGASKSCGTLFTAATPAGGSAPTDTITAMLNVAKAPGRNVTSLYGLTTTQAPFQPTLTTAPNDFTVSLVYQPAGAFSAPSAAALDVNGNLWVTNSGNNSLSEINAVSGTAAPGLGGSLNAPSGIAFDANGNAWVTNKGNSTLSVFSSGGVGNLTSVGAGQLNAPSAIAIDGQNLLWITNSGNSTVALIAVSGTTPTSSTVTGAGTAGVSGPLAVAINPH